MCQPSEGSALQVGFCRFVAVLLFVISDEPCELRLFFRASVDVVVLVLCLVV